MGKGKVKVFTTKLGSSRTRTKGENEASDDGDAGKPTDQETDLTATGR